MSMHLAIALVGDSINYVYYSLLAVPSIDPYPTAKVCPCRIIGPSIALMQNSAPGSSSLYVYDSFVNATSNWKVS